MYWDLKVRIKESTWEEKIFMKKSIIPKYFL